MFRPHHVEREAWSDAVLDCIQLKEKYGEVQPGKNEDRSKPTRLRPGCHGRRCTDMYIPNDHDDVWWIPQKNIQVVECAALFSRSKGQTWFHQENGD
ncbi:hypothetical protein H0H93_016312 [Arthromyces matolae]|nr:hypothetical protein H0H93_016312 [Arthromyces matolae]